MPFKRAPRFLALQLADVIAWGRISINTARPSPPLDGFNNIAEVAAGPFHAAMRTKEGRVVLWGGMGSMAGDKSKVLAQVTNTTNITAIASGDNAVLALTDKGEVLCIPDTGFVDKKLKWLCSLPPVPWGVQRPALAGSAGGNRTVRAIRASMRTYLVQLDDANGTWLSYGSNIDGLTHPWVKQHGGAWSAEFGQQALELGDLLTFENSFANQVHLVTMKGGQSPLMLRRNGNMSLPAWANDSPPAGVKSLCTCITGLTTAVVALLRNGSVTVWNTPGKAPLSPPADLPQGNVTGTACGEEHVVVALNNGSTRAWLAGSEQRVGILEPPVRGTVAVRAVAAGYAYNVFLSRSGNVYQTGSVQNEAPSPLPDVLLNPLGLATSVSAGGDCALAQLQGEGGVAAWGDNLYQISQLPPDLASNPIVQVSAGLGHALALLADGSVVTWGFQTSTSLQIPPDVRQQRIAAVAAGYNYSVAVTQDGARLLLWGNFPCDNLRWGLSNANPVPVHDVAQVSAGTVLLMVLLRNGTVLVNGCATVLLPSLKEYQGNVSQVAAGTDSALLLLKSGRVVPLGKAWSSLMAVPEAIQGQVSSVSTGAFHALALLKNGSLVSWGKDGVGQVSGMPPEVAKGNVTAMSAGSAFSLAIVDPSSIIPSVLV
jgi:alpha-tubulin suppressor-like RCC1 family protein